MTTVTLGSTTLGAGKPKILVPLTGSSASALLTEARALEGHTFDIVEWRIDHLAPSEGDPEAWAPFSQILAVGSELKQILGDSPLLVTFRTAHEGGARAISDAAYGDLLCQIAQSKLADAIDVEAFRSRDVVDRIIATAKNNSVVVVASNHDFDATPQKAEIVRRLRFMQDELGADVPKIAVMPHSAGDVLTLLSATWEMASVYATQPIITMSMAGTGVVSRLAGQTFGSAATFGAVGNVSAPGQVDADQLATVLTVIDAAQE